VASIRIARRMTPAAYIDAHAADLLSLLRRLIRLPTVNPPGLHYDEITRLLVVELQQAGLTARRLPVPQAWLRRHLAREQWNLPRWNVLGTLRKPSPRGGPRRQTLHFNAHYDVVPAAAEGWSSGGPFSGAEISGWLHGRGAADMKGAIASLLLALRALRATKTTPRLDLEVSFTADEETDSALGTGWLVQHAPIKPDYALVLEGGEGPEVCVGHNGVVWLEVRVDGRAAHGSRPEEGINAFEHAARLALLLRDEHAAEIACRTFTAPDGRIARPTLNIGGVFAGGDGAKVNTVPAHARFTIDRRVLPGETAAAAERALRRFLAAAARRLPKPRPRVRVHKISENHSCYAAPEHPFAETLRTIVAAERGRPARFGTSTGFNDMHFFAQQLGVPTLGYGPGGENCHGTNERARVSELLASAQIYARLLTEPWAT
jgi:succinyl-diaminopimelate desuccinylase